MEAMGTAKRTHMAVLGTPLEVNRETHAYMATSLFSVAMSPVRTGDKGSPVLETGAGVINV